MIYPVRLDLVVEPSVGDQVPGASVPSFWGIVSTWIQEIVLLATSL